MAVSPWGDLSLYTSRMEAINRVKAAQQRSVNVIEDLKLPKPQSPTVDNSEVSSNNNEFNMNGSNKNDNQNNGTNGRNNMPNGSNTSNGFNMPNGFNQQNQGGFNPNLNSSYNMGGQRQNTAPQRGNGGSPSATISNILSSFMGGGNKAQNGNINGIKNQLGEITKPFSKILDSFDIDSEKLIIIMIMWVLFNEKSDKTLLLALGYLLL